MTYKSDEGLYESYNFYTFTTSYFEGYRHHYTFGHVTTWTSDQPQNSGDNIAPTSMYGRFRGQTYGDNPEGHERIDRSLFEMFEWEDF
jgi:hypothetical protein